jgi:hypothetical protein
MLLHSEKRSTALNSSSISIPHSHTRGPRDSSAGSSVIVAFATGKSLWFGRCQGESAENGAEDGPGGHADAAGDVQNEQNGEN